MTKDTPGSGPTTYSKALSDAIRKTGRRHEDLAAKLNVTPGLVSAWVTGRKPVPATRARSVADELGNVTPDAISKAYAEIARQEGGGAVLPMPGAAPVHPVLALHRVENDIDSLRWFVTVLVDVMLRHRPAEAADVLATIERQVPRKYRDSGFLLELTEALAPRVAAPAKGRGAARQPAKPRS